MRIWSWNIARRSAAWKAIADDTSLDVALLQEATPPSPQVPLHGLDVTPGREERWATSGSTRDYRTAIAWRRQRIDADVRQLGCIGDDVERSLCVSRTGTLTALDVHLPDGDLTLISAYGFWETPRSEKKQPWIYADASAHRIISDISALIDSERDHRILLAGDFNILHGYGEHGSEYWKARYATVFSRFDALGFSFVGPQARNNERQAVPWPKELPLHSKNVPTYHTNRQTPDTATRQLDFVFASNSIANRIRVRAINGIADWGPSDHCRVEIVIESEPTLSQRLPLKTQVF